jgi:hypothetical protein
MTNETHHGARVYVPTCRRCGAARATRCIVDHRITEFDRYVIDTVCDDCFNEIAEFINHRISRGE